MKLCIFADIHGNGPAFKVAYPQILAEQADLNIFLGDLCGYYYDQLEIFPMLCKMPNLMAIMGNHDRIFLDIFKGDNDLRESYLQKYGHSMENLLSQEYNGLAEWLMRLPKSYKDAEKRFTCFHGSPQNPLDGYIYPDSPLGTLGELSEAFLFLGHTHYKMNRSVGETMIVNPGSLGQPRDGGWPTYVVAELPSNRVNFKYVAYDREALRRRIDEFNEKNEYLREVLSR